jgi:hypothetical protein
MKRKLGRATKPESNLDQMIADLVEMYGISLLLAEMTIHETGAVGSALGRLFEKLKIDWDDLADMAHFADPPLPEGYWAHDLVAAYGMPAIIKALESHMTGRGWPRGWRQAFRELSRAAGNQHRDSNRHQMGASRQ